MASENIIKAETIEREMTGLFRDAFGIDNTSITRLPQAGGDRIYYRLTNIDYNLSAIGVIGPDIKENLTFLNLSKCLKDAGIPVPDVFATSNNGRCYLLEDLGDTNLLDLIRKGENTEIEEICIKTLARLQTLPKEIWSNEVQFPRFGSRQTAWDLNYFKYEFLKPSGIVFDEELLERDFDSIKNTVEEWPEELSGFMYRDFQSRNIMIKDGKPRFIDYQGAREGPAIYDAISFLWQAKANFTPDRKETLMRIYAREFSRIRGVSEDKILLGVPFMTLLRLLQVLGAYGFRGLVEKRSHFIESIPAALSNLRQIVEEGAADGLPELKRISLILASDRRFRQEQANTGLTVKVYSFSYKKGYPDDFTGNGGGFMFDCRSMHNPGRYPQYIHLTGRDQPVVDFLEDHGEVFTFLKGAWIMTDAAIDRYISRGFSSLQIGFGCTGGQHRSVYCAEATARHIAQKFPKANVRLIHREQGIEENLSGHI